MAATITIREARRDDVAFLIRGIAGLAAFENISEENHADPDLLRLHLFGEHPVCEAIVGEVDGEPGGYALFFSTYSTFLTRPGIFLEDLFVFEEHRACGLGRALLSRVTEIADERGCGRVEWSVLDWNERAIRFYRAAGASPVQGWATYRLVSEPPPDTEKP